MTRISDMTPLSTIPPTGAYVPVEKTGSATNYRFDLGNIPTSDGLFINASALSVPSGFNIVPSSGYLSLDVGAAAYVHDAAVDTAYVAAHPRSSFISVNGRGFRLSLEQSITPGMLGAAGDGVADDYPAFQAALDLLPAAGGNITVLAGTYKLLTTPTWGVKDVRWNISPAATFTGAGAALFVSTARPFDYSSTRALSDMLKDMRVKATSCRARLGRFSDVYTDQTGINAGASQYYDWDTRKVVGPQRAFKSTVAAEENFDDISDWTTVVRVVGGINPSDPDPAVGLVAEMDTGATPGNTATIRKLFGTIPASFGVSVLMQMATTNTLASEATEFQAQNANGHLLRMRIYSGAVQFFHDGAWTTAYAYGGGTTFYTEWWIETTFNSGSNYTVRLFAGTQELPGFTGDLPNGTGGENGWVSFIQYSNAVANRKARIALLQVGSSALPQNMSLVSVAQDVVTEPTTISLALLVEDVCLQTVFNTDLIVSISKNGSAGPWYLVTLINYDEVAAGILTVTSPVNLLAGSVTMPVGSGTHSVACKITSANGRYFSLNGFAFRVDA